MIALPIISIVCCFAYIFFVTFKYDVPVSLSETYYLLPKKWNWLFSAWCTLTAAPMGIYWYTIAPKNLVWMPIVVMVSVLMIGVSCCYKAPVVKDESITRGNLKSVKKSWKEFWKDLIEKFKPSNFLKNGWAKPIHYVASLVTIGLCTAYICIVNKIAIPSVVLSYVTFIIIGINVEGTYNKDYSTDVDNKSWIFFMEIVCLTQLFTFVWTTI